MLMVPPVTGIMVTGGASMMPRIRCEATALPIGCARDPPGRVTLVRTLEWRCVTGLEVKTHS